MLSPLKIHKNTIVTNRGTVSPCPNSEKKHYLKTPEIPDGKNTGKTLPENT
jgi:hypothetical protein